MTMQIFILQTICAYFALLIKFYFIMDNQKKGLDLTDHKIIDHEFRFHVIDDLYEKKFIKIVWIFDSFERAHV